MDIPYNFFFQKEIYNFFLNNKNYLFDFNGFEHKQKINSMIGFLF